MTAPESGSAREKRSTMDLVRIALLAILAFGLVGTEIELVLLEHTDGVWQIVPIAAIVSALLVVVWHVARRNAASVRALQALMWVFILSGAIGSVLHFNGNVAYERDSDPSLSGTALYRGALSGSTPTLAPGTMIQLGLIGLVFAFRHPSLKRSLTHEPPTDRKVT